MNFLRIAWNDICKVFENKFIRASIVAIIIVPLLYSFMYLYAFWDPYKNLSKIPIAVANSDEGTITDGSSHNYGNDIIDTLKKNNEVGWKFVSENDAKNGVEKGKYYAMFIIPNDFSKDVVSAKNGKANKPQIKYVSNDKKNFIASQIDKNVATALKEEINKTITSEYTKGTYDKLHELKNGMSSAADGSSQLYNGLSTAQNGSKLIRDNLKTLNESAPQLENGVVELYKGSIDLSNGLDQADTGSKSLSDNLLNLKNSSPAIADGVNRLFIGSDQLDNGINTLNMSVTAAGKQFDSFGGIKTILNPSTINSAKNLFNDAEYFANVDTRPISTLVSLISPNAINSLSNVTTDYKGLFPNGFEQSDAYKGLQVLLQPQNLQSGIKLVTDANDLTNVNINYLAPISAILNGSDKITKLLNDTRPVTSINLDDYKAFISTQESGANTFIATAQQLNSKNADFKNAINASNLPDSTKSELVTIINGYYKLTDDTSTSYKNSAAALQKMSNDLNSLGTIQNDLKDNSDLINQVGTALTPENVAYFKSILSKLPEIKTDLDNNQQNIAVVKQLVQKLSSPESADTMSKLNNFKNDLDTLQPILKNISSNIDQNTLIALSKSPELVNNLLSMQNDLKSNNSLLVLAENALSQNNIEMAQKLFEAMPQLTDGVNRLKLGSEQLNGGLKQLNSQMPALVSGSSQLYNGSLALNNGLSKLSTGSNSMRNGLSTLNSKMPQLKDGTNKLYNGSSSLYDGFSKLSNGSIELKNGLNNGVDQISSNLKISTANACSFISEPLNMKLESYDKVPNYGTGFTPYFIPLSLWVGALMMFFVVDDRVDGEDKIKPSSIVLGKYMTYGFIGIAQAVLASTIVITLGLKANNIPLFYLFNILMSFSFIAIIQCLVFLLGQVGKLLSIILLILQLTSCAGTFPLEVIPKFFRILYPFMPFTYCVSALREIISGSNYLLIAKDAAVLFGIIVVFLFISILMKSRADKLRDKILTDVNNASNQINQ